MGYNTHNVSFDKTINDELKITPPKHVVLFSGKNCEPKEWTVDLHNLSNIIGFCECCQTNFIVKKELVFQYMGDEQSELRQKSYIMTIEDVFEIDSSNTYWGKLTVVVGQAESGFIQTGDRVIISSGIKQVEALVCGIEMFRKVVPYAEFGDSCGLILNVEKREIQKGSILTKSTNYLDNRQNIDTYKNHNENELEYLEEFKNCLINGGKISQSERRLLDKLRENLGLTQERTLELELSAINPLTSEESEYFNEYKYCYQENSAISLNERRLLDKLRIRLQISEERAKQIESMI